jgi:hypothetical protein
MMMMWLGRKTREPEEIKDEEMWLTCTTSRRVV